MGMKITLMLGVGALAIGTTARAQMATPATMDEASPVPAQAVPDADLGDIVVTAQKRTQSVQDVPLAVQVVTAQQLEVNAVRDFADLNRVAPSLVVRPAEHPVNANISIRGIGTLAFSPGVEPSVAVVVDDVPIAFQARAFADLADVERIEVLRGPQSTLYGKSASAGLINIVTPGPSATFTTRYAGLVTADGEEQVNVIASGPIIDGLGFRSSVNFNQYDGNVRNIASGRKVNGKRLFSARNKVVFAPNEDFTMTVGVDVLHGRTSVGRPFIALSDAARLRGQARFTPAVFAPGITPGFDNREVANNVTTGTRYKDFAQSLRIAYDTGGPTVMAITSHDKFRLYDTLDSDESALPTYDNRQFGKFASEQFTQELRLISPGRQRLRYTVGLFYADVDYARDFTRGPIFSAAQWESTNGSRQVAGFGQVEFDILPDTTLIGGARYSNERIRYVYTDRLAANARFQGNSSDSFGTYRLGVQQLLARDVMVFVTYATGHKGEAYDISSGFNRNRALAGPVRPETSRDWEAGVRSQLFDRLLTLNATVFDTRFRNFQAQGIEVLADGTINYRLTNVGRLRTRGIELEASSRPADNLSLGGSMALLDARITEFTGAQCYPGQTAAQGCIGTPARQDLSGTRPPQAPRLKLSVNADYAHSLGDLPFRGVVQGAYTYQGRVNYQLAADPLTVQPGYGIANVSVGIRGENRQWNVMAFVNNAFDTRYHFLLNNASGNYGNQLALQGYVPRDFRRYVGVRSAVRF